MSERPHSESDRESRLDSPASAPVGKPHSETQLREGTENFYEGSEPFFTFFTQPQVLLSTIRLTVDQQLAVNVSDLSSQMEAARRGFQHSGNIIMACQEVARIASLFQIRVQAWERELQLQQSNKRKMSGMFIHKLKAEAAQIRGRVSAIDRALVKLEVTLHQMAGEARDSDRVAT